MQAHLSDSAETIIRLLFDNGEESKDRVGSYIVRRIIFRLRLIVPKIIFHFFIYLVGAAICETSMSQVLEMLLLKTEVYFTLTQSEYSNRK